jgi:hypothetical protein
MSRLGQQATLSNDTQIRRNDFNRGIGYRFTQSKLACDVHISLFPRTDRTLECVAKAFHS